LVTGGAGFIGSHLVEQLLSDGHSVTVLDDFSTGNPVNLRHVENDPKLTLHRVDISLLDDMHPLFDGIDWVFHLAALADIVPSIEEPVKYHKANVDGTVAVLEASRHAGVKRFVYSASSSCYGIPDQVPTLETSPIRPMYPYALTKNLGEQCVMHWNQVYQLPCIALRLFNVYGPRARANGTYGAVFGVFLAQKLAGKPFTVVGDGTQTRDFIFVTDVATAFLKAAKSSESGEILNVGSGGTYSVNRLVELLGGDVINLPKRPGEPDSTFADTRKIKQMFGWQPQVSFEQGVKIMLENIEMWGDAPVWEEESISKATEDWFKYLDRPSDNHSGIPSEIHND
jgi:UDP-glucose 4-epimerase